ncbi:MAG TPA: RDD family protein [Gemmataceae bacterium]|nr:RDD family protein [Gemmataceae bacterium]
MILHEVLTTERVPFYYRVAGLGSRTLAWLIDFLLILLLWGAGGLFVIFSPLGLAGAGMGLGVLMVWVTVVYWGYFLLFEWLWNGQTPGKRVLGIRVIQHKGTALTFYHSAVRNIVRVIDSLPGWPFIIWPGCYALGFAIAACNKKNRRLGDFAGDTLVVHVEQGIKPIRALVESRTEADRARLALWRQRLSSLSRDQKQTLLDLALRRDKLRVAERTQLFRSVAQFFESRLELTPDQFESDEKFVLQLAAVLSEQGPPEDGPGGLNVQQGPKRR